MAGVTLSLSHTVVTCTLGCVCTLAQLVCVCLCVCAACVCVSCACARAEPVCVCVCVHLQGSNESGQLGLGVTAKLRLVPALIQRLPEDWMEHLDELKTIAERQAVAIGPSALRVAHALSYPLCVARPHSL